MHTSPSGDGRKTICQRAAEYTCDDKGDSLYQVHVHTLEGK